MNFSRATLLLCLSIATLSSPASAGIIVSFGPSVPAPMLAGSSGTIDVFVRADVGTETLDGFLVEVGLAGGPPGGLIFSPVQTESQLTDPNYVFFGNSLSQNTMVPVGVVGPTDTYTGADFTDDGTGPPPAVGNPMPVTLTTTNRLLYRLNLTAVTAGTYTIDVNALTSAFLSDQLLFTTVPFTSTAGSITVSAVPEPSTFILFSLTAAGAVVTRLRNRRKSAARPVAE